MQPAGGEFCRQHDRHHQRDAASERARQLCFRLILTFSQRMNRRARGLRLAVRRPRHDLADVLPDRGLTPAVGWTGGIGFWGGNHAVTYW